MGNIWSKRSCFFCSFRCHLDGNSHHQILNRPTTVSLKKSHHIQESFVDVTCMARADFTSDAVVELWSCGLASTAKRSGLFSRFSCSLRMICKRTLPKSNKKKGWAVVLMQMLCGTWSCIDILQYITYYMYTSYIYIYIEGKWERERLYKILWTFAMSSGQHNPYPSQAASNCASVQIAMVASSSNTTSNTTAPTYLAFECVNC